MALGRVRPAVCLMARAVVNMAEGMMAHALKDRGHFSTLDSCDTASFSISRLLFPESHIYS